MQHKHIPQSFAEVQINIYTNLALAIFFIIIKVKPQITITTKNITTAVIGFAITHLEHLIAPYVKAHKQIKLTPLTVQ